MSLLQQRKSDRAERTVLLVHVGSFVALATGLGAALLLRVPDVTVAGAVAAAVLHAIYSLSWLELWALSDGSLSLRILAATVKARRRSRGDIVAAHLPLVTAKKSQRIDGLVALGLVRKDNGSYHLTGRGRRLSGVLMIVGGSAGFNEGG